MSIPFALVKVVVAAEADAGRQSAASANAIASADRLPLAVVNPFRCINE